MIMFSMHVIGRSSSRRPVSFTSFPLLCCKKGKLFCSFHGTMEKNRAEKQMAKLNTYMHQLY